jgi:hypothetical protein
MLVWKSIFQSIMMCYDRQFLNSVNSFLWETYFLSKELLARNAIQDFLRKSATFKQYPKNVIVKE